MTRIVRSTWHTRPYVVALVAAAAITCALVIVAAIRADSSTAPPRVCVSSATASATEDGPVVETESAVDCDP